jgi:pimeloyl-ACP methyl ester carboxylesterase
MGKLSGEFKGVDFREEDFKAYWDHIALLDPDLFLATLRAAGEHSAEDLLGEITVPTLVVGAERDTFTPPARAQEMADRIPTADFHLLNDSSHAAPVELPMTIYGIMKEFLLRTESSRALTPSDVDAE